MNRKCVPLMILALLLGACSKPEEASRQAAAPGAPAMPAAPAAQSAPAPQAHAPAERTPDQWGASYAKHSSTVGEEIYIRICAVCHDKGVTGAPALGNKDDWSARQAQGKDALYKHALLGFTGKKGVMPAKGGNMGLEDTEVKAAVDYMLAQVK